MHRSKVITTTIGDLIVALHEETARYVHDEHEIDELVASMVTDLLNDPRLSFKQSGHSGSDWSLGPLTIAGGTK